jgi:hypothetical protein
VPAAAVAAALEHLARWDTRAPIGRPAARVEHEQPAA